MAELYTKSGLKLASGFIRIVHGGRGDYYEFEPEQIIWDNIFIPDDQKWRLLPKYRDDVFYEEFRTSDSSFVKVYYQRKFVGYADYNPGMLYCSVNDLFMKDNGG